MQEHCQTVAYGPHLAQHWKALPTVSSAYHSATMLTRSPPDCCSTPLSTIASAQKYRHKAYWGSGLQTQLSVAIVWASCEWQNWMVSGSPNRDHISVHDFFLCWATTSHPKKLTLLQNKNKQKNYCTLLALIMLNQDMPVLITIGVTTHNCYKNTLNLFFICAVKILLSGKIPMFHHTAKIHLVKYFQVFSKQP